MIQRFKGVLLKPLDQQHDRDRDHIDPAGVAFDPEEWTLIHRGFDYSQPPIGRGKVRREEDGSLVMEGEFFERQLNDTENPWKLAIGVVVEHEDIVDGAYVKSKLMGSVGLTPDHVDETQPPIEFIEERHMNIVRLGHYHVPSGPGEKGSCQWATVIKVVEDDPTRAVVNLKVIDGDGDEFKRLGVRQDDPYRGIERGEATFHLSGECPWGK